MGDNLLAPHPQPVDLKRRWLARALSRAGIDASRWVPARGAAANRDTIEAVYRYYAQLYLSHDRLKWAGMAALVGPSFYAGFLDIDSVPGGLLRFYETSFLEMQRKIFEDQSVMHEAYLSDGLAGIHALAAAGIINSASVLAWEQIDSREGMLVDAGNRTLLYREQHDIIDRFYVRVHGHDGASGSAFTYALTLAGRPSVPGARPYAAVFPVALAAGIAAGATLTLATPLADGNIAVFSNRWKLIEDDTFPAFLRFLGDTERARRLIGTPIQRRVRRFLIARRAGQLAVGLLTRWHVQFGLTAANARRPSRQNTTPPAVRDAATVEIDLTTPPTRAAAGFAESGDHRVWTRADHGPFPVRVSLPEGRVYEGPAQLVTLVSPTPGGDPKRLTVKLPPTNRAGALAVLLRLASAWGFSEDALEEWYRRPRSARLRHAYSTRVFVANPVGFVLPEFQVEHHVQDAEYVIDILFSWA